MAIIVKANQGGGYPPIEAGSYRAICYGIVVEGTFINPFNQKKQTKVRFLWEFPDERILKDGKDLPRAFSEEYTLTLGEQGKLRPRLESWRGKAFTKQELEGFDIENVLKAPCLITTMVGISKQGREYASITAVGRLPKGMEVPRETENPAIVFNVCDPECPLEKMEQLPDWIQNRIKDSLEYKERTTTEDDFTIVANDEDLPFD